MSESRMLALSGGCNELVINNLDISLLHSSFIYANLLYVSGFFAQGRLSASAGISRGIIAGKAGRGVERDLVLP